MNIQQLKVIVELSKGRTLVEIGKALGLTQPTVSFHIRKIEEDIGVPLVVKERRSLKLTPACHELVPYASKILELMDEAKQRVYEAQGLLQPRLRIGAGHTPSTYYLPPYIQQFQQQHPDVEVSISVHQARRAIEMLRNHEIDIAVVSLKSFSIEGLNIHPLIEDKLLLVYSPMSRLASQSAINMDDLGRETFLLHEQGSTSRIVTDEWAEHVGLTMQHTMELGAIETIKESVKANMGVGVLPEKSVRRELETGELFARPLPQYEYRRCICLVYRNEANMSDQVRDFIWFAIENMK